MCAAKKGIDLNAIKEQLTVRKRELEKELTELSERFSFIVADGSKEVESKIQDFVREDLIKKNNYIIWEKEFEDIFDNVVLSKAFNSWQDSEGFESHIDAKYLVDNYSENGSVVNIFKKYIHEKELIGLNKPALAEQIIQDILTDMKPEAIEQLPVMEPITKIIELLDAK